MLKSKVGHDKVSRKALEIDTKNKKGALLDTEIILINLINFNSKLSPQAARTENG